MPELTESQIERYSRQLLLPGWGSREQLRLQAVHIAVSAKLEAAALYLAGAGIGRISIVNAEDDSLVKKLVALNPEVASGLLSEEQGPADIALVGIDEIGGLNAARIVHSGDSLSEQALSAAKLLLELTDAAG